MRQKSLVVCLSGEGWERLSLAPRLRADETLSSWMERFAGAYALKVREFAEWLRYRPLHCVYAAWRLDLDVSPPADFAVRLAQLTGLCAREIEAHRLAASGMLVPHLRRTFCPQCWAEEGPYRRREWASAWSLVCPRHRRLLSEKPLPPPFRTRLRRILARVLSSSESVAGAATLLAKQALEENLPGPGSRAPDGVPTRMALAAGAVRKGDRDRSSDRDARFTEGAVNELGIPRLCRGQGPHGQRSQGQTRPDTLRIDSVQGSCAASSP